MSSGTAPAPAPAPAPVCEKCEVAKAKSGGAAEQVSQDAAMLQCKEQYTAVSGCMKAHRYRNI
jgi:hypothetical protein